MIDHIGISVANYDESKEFYTKALAPLGYTLVMEAVPPQHTVRAAGFGKDGKPDFWIAEEGKTTPHTHIAIVAESREVVDAFYKAALEAGAKDNGAPGIRAHYHPHYYGAFVLDMDGHNIEAVCHKPK
jgi:catechol 2,3-dioxygenase-like lactoylglutathione lyase family enzyme